MRTGLAMGVVALAATPALLAGTVEWLHEGDIQRVLAGEDIDLVAGTIAEREFRANVTIELIEDARTRAILGDSNLTLKAGPGREYARLTITFANDGRVPVSVFTHHFTARDTSNAKYRPIWALPERIEGWNLKQGSAIEGIVVFDVPRDTQLATLTWEGEMGERTVTLSGAP